MIVFEYTSSADRAYFWRVWMLRARDAGLRFTFNGEG